jgi:hypothetical protein
MRLGIEPKGVDFEVDPTIQTKADREFISQVIAHYNATGEITRAPLPKIKQSKAKKKLFTKP